MEQIIRSMPEMMQVMMVRKEEMELLYKRMDCLEEAIRDRNFNDQESEWLDSEEVRMLLGISPKTWQKYRDEHLISYYQINKKILVKRSDLNKFMADHFIPARA